LVLLGLSRQGPGRHRLSLGLFGPSRFAGPSHAGGRYVVVRSRSPQGHPDRTEVPRRAAEVRIGLSEEIAFARTRPMGGIPVASPTFAAISAVAPASPGSEVCKQRRVSRSHDALSGSHRKLGISHRRQGAPLQKFKIDLARVRAQSVTSYRVATSRAGPRQAQLHWGISALASGSGKRLYSRGCGKI
jgi:hypothetical protein